MIKMLSLMATGMRCFIGGIPMIAEGLLASFHDEI